MSERILDVYMDGVRIGLVSMTEAGALGFSYDDAYREHVGATPLSLSMPLQVKQHPNRAVLPFLQGLLPDNALALDSMASFYHVSPSSPFALLENMGHDVAGALQIVKPGESSEDAEADRRLVEPLSPAGLEKLLRDTISVYEQGAPVRTVQRMSLAGAQAKVALAKTADGTWGMPARGVPSTHIFKPQLTADEAFPDVDVVEYFCQKVAREVGLRSADTQLWQSDDGSVGAIISRRYDRKLKEDGTYSRLHQEDLCQAMSIPPAKKYQRDDGGPGIGRVGQLLKTRLNPVDAKNVASDFLAAVTLNAALMNTDAHAKNYSLMLSGNSVTLAPLYDVLSIAAFLPEDTHPLFSMRLGKTFDLEHVFPETIAGEGTRLGLDRVASGEIVHRVLSETVKALPNVARQCSDLDRDGIITRTVETLIRRSSLLTSL
jgi:serine/threonine-protein kinase HipA